MGFFNSIGNFFKGAAGSIASGLFGLGSSAVSAASSNKQIDKQIAAQKEENEKNRAYNLQLAQMQNAWNQEQWERENEYNSPVNQMKRFEEAGLNPDLMYGQGNSGNAMQLSGGMTSGAPSSPTDYSALGQKKTLGDVIRDSLNNEMMRAQIDNIRADSQQKRGNAKLTQYEIDKQDALRLLTGSDAEDMLSQLDDSNPIVRRFVVELANMEKDYGLKANEMEGQHYDNIIKKENSDLASEFAQKQLKKLSAELKISEKEAEYLTKTIAARIRGVKIDTDLKENELQWSDMSKLGSVAPQIISLLRLIFLHK